MKRFRLVALFAVSAVLLAVAAVWTPGRTHHVGPTLANTGPSHAQPASARESRLIPPSAASAAGGATFGQPTIVGVQGTGFEEDIRLDSQDRVYTSVPASLSSGTSWLWRSQDHGKTFKWIPAAAPLTGKLPTCAGGGDTELGVDSADHLYFNDLTLVNFSTARSDDHGQTMVPGDCQSVATTPNDRQWYATDGDPTSGGSLYLVYDIVGLGPPSCGSSTGNNTLVMARSPADPALGATAGNTFAPSQFVTNPTACDEGIMGNDEVSPTTHHIFVVHDDAFFHKIGMGRCVAVPFTTDPTGLQCTDHLVADLGPNFRTGGSFPTMAVDKAGNLYAVWEQAPVNANNEVTGDTILKWSSSTDEGNHWTTPITIPTPGLHNNVMAWPAAGDSGRVDIAWYGTPAVAGAPVNDPNCNNMLGATKSGPDNTNGLWSLYYSQTLNGTAATPTFSAPVVASQHFIHKGSIQTVMGGQCGDRTLGDFIQLRIGQKGEANISYGDSNNIDEAFAPHPMFVRQIGGTSVFSSVGTVTGSKAPVNTTPDASGDGRFDAATQTSANQKNLDILSSTISQPDATHYQVTMQVADLTSLAPDPSTGNTDTTLIWQTQWLKPSTTDVNGGANFMVYMESQNGGAPTFWVGQNAVTVLGGGVITTYAGDHTVPGSYTATAPGTITITVPAADVNVAGGLDTTLYQVTASTHTMTGSASNPPSLGGIGGTMFNLIDVAPGYNFVPGSGGGGGGGGTPSCTIKGTSGADNLVGTDVRDVICGLGGNDTINGKGGNDFVTGDKGQDTIVGGAGNDNLKGGYGNDTIDTRDSTTGNDKMDGGQGTDKCTGDSGDSKVDCES